MRALKDRYGFLFWLRWIVSFAGSFIVSAIAWTVILNRIFGAVEAEELVMTWAVSVFGTWFILVIPFMRKKEQIWKRLNDDQERSVDAWLTGMGFFIGAFVVSAFVWGLVFKQRLLSGTPGLDPVWMRAVFSTWVIILVPLLIWMYRSADRIFKTANERQTREPAFQRQWVTPDRRLLPQALSEKLQKEKPTLSGGHLVKGRFKNGDVWPLFILNGREVIGAYDYSKTDFDASQLIDVAVEEPVKLPIPDESRWVRFNIEP